MKTAQSAMAVGYPLEAVKGKTGPAQMLITCQHANQSFSSRQCIGMNMSLAEQRVLLSMMAKKFQWSLPKDSIHKDGMDVEGMDVMGPKDLVLDFKKRY